MLARAFLRALSAPGLKVHLLDRAPDRAQGFFLFEAEGFVTAGELQEISAVPTARNHGVGAYSVPLVWPRGDGVVALRSGAP